MSKNLAQTKNYLILDYIQNGICIIDRNYKIIFWNKCLERWTRKEKKDVINTDLRTHFPKLNEPRYTCRIDSLWDGGVPVIFSSHLHHYLFKSTLPNGQERIQHTTVTPIPNPDRGDALALFAIEDVTDLSIRISRHREISEELRKAKNAAQSASEAKSQFLANFSHEIRTPMNAILGFIEILSDQIKNVQHLTYLDNIAAASKALLSLINDILDLSKVEAGQIEINMHPVELRILLNEIRQLFLYKMEKKNLDWHCHIDDALPEIIMIDETRLRQILLNIAGNAVKFTEKGQICINAKWIPERKSEKTGDLWLTVSDTGIGIPEDQHDIIFEAFRRQSGAHMVKYEGTGLGLAISQRLVHMLNGEIHLKSTPENGSEFSLHFRRVAAAEKSCIKHEHFIKTDEQDKYVNNAFIQKNDNTDININAEKLAHFLEHEAAEQWHNLKKTYIIDQIESFARQINQISNAYGAVKLKIWSEQLLDQALHFRMDLLPQTLSQFESIKQEICSIAKEINA